MPRVFVLNGVNLAALGERRPEVYGEQTLRDIEHLLRSSFPDVELEFRQTDHEGEFVGWIQEAADSDGLIVNPGGPGGVAAYLGRLSGCGCGGRGDGRKGVSGGGQVYPRGAGTLERALSSGKMVVRSLMRTELQSVR